VKAKLIDAVNTVRELVDDDELHLICELATLEALCEERQTSRRSMQRKLYEADAVPLASDQQRLLYDPKFDQPEPGRDDDPSHSPAQ
jgi:hypothetical protein